jgi:predicted transposase/invertase (TIGR01784 family)
MQQHIRFDWAIKYVLRNKANFGILEGFLSELLAEPVVLIDFLESESNKVDERAKFNRVDLFVRNSKGELIIIEVQNTREYDYFHRMVWGVSKAITEHIKQGEAYGEIKKVISISIVYFDLGQGEDYIYKGTTIFKGLNNNDILNLSDEQKRLFAKEQVEDIFPTNYIIKVQKFKNQITKALDEWIYFFKNSEIKEEFTAKGLKEAKEKLAFVKMNKEEQLNYNSYLEDLHYEASINQTVNFDAQEKIAKEIAKSLKENGVSIEIIAKATGISKNEIEKL